jgi:hypothetical protein
LPPGNGHIVGPKKNGTDTLALSFFAAAADTFGDMGIQVRRQVMP